MRTTDVQSNLEKNCNHIFTKGPTLTKDFLEKVQAEIVPKKTDFFGYRVQTSRFLLLSGLLLLFSTSFISTVLLWTTNIYNDSIHSLMVISNTSSFYPLWQKAPVKPLLKFYLFNYTNVDRFENHLDARPHVEEIGPYVYEEQLEKVNVRFSEDGETVSYQEKRMYRFIPELSNGTVSDQIVVPNIILLSGAATVKYLNFLLRVSFSTFLKSLSQKPFITLQVDQLINGYEDHLFDFSKSVMKFRNQRVYDSFGLLTARAGVQPDVVTVNTGAMDIQKLGQIQTVNGESSFSHWASDECNNFQVSDGTTYPMNQIQNKQTVKLFALQFCRKLPMVFKKETNILGDKVPAYRYEIPENVFDTPEENAENSCYCDSESSRCPPKGLSNVTTCFFGAPLFNSAPHFYGADEAVQNGVTGLDPDNKPHVSYANIQPTMGFVMSGHHYFQVNVQVLKSFGVSQVNIFEDGAMLPIVWMDVGVEEANLPEEVLSVIYRASFTAPAVESGLKYGCVLTAVVTSLCIVLIVRNVWLQRRKEFV